MKTNKILFVITGLIVVTIFIYLVAGFIDPVNIYAYKTDDDGVYKIKIEFNAFGSLMYANSDGSGVSVFRNIYDLSRNEAGPWIGARISTKFNAEANFIINVRSEDGYVVCEKYDQDGYLRTLLSEPATYHKVYVDKTITKNQKMFCVLIIEIYNGDKVSYRAIFVSLGDPTMREERRLRQQVISSYDICRPSTSTRTRTNRGRLDGRNPFCAPRPRFASTYLLALR